MIADGMLESLSSIDTLTMRVGMIVLGVTLVSIAIAFSLAWKSVRRSEHRTRLTAMMLERGMKSEEIERVLVSGFIDAEPPDEKQQAGADPEVRIVTHLAACSYDGDDIQKVMGAARLGGAIDESAVKMIKSMASNWVDADDIAKVLMHRTPRPAQGAMPNMPGVPQRG